MDEEMGLREVEELRTQAGLGDPGCPVACSGISFVLSESALILLVLWLLFFQTKASCCFVFSWVLVGPPQSRQDRLFQGKGKCLYNSRQMPQQEIGHIE